MDVPKSETEEQQQQTIIVVDGTESATTTPDSEETTSLPPTISTPSPSPPSYSTARSSFFSSFRSNSPTPSAFGPTIAADRAEEFSRSWMARSLPRNMRRQIHEAAQAAAAANRESVIELPARMTSGSPASTAPSSPNNTTTAIHIPTTTTEHQHDTLTTNNQQQQSSSLGQRFRRTLPRFLKP